jgi:cyclic beta-1,2-glucan synthetase
MLSEQSPNLSASQASTGVKITDISYLETLAIDAAHSQTLVSQSPGRQPTLIDRLDVLQDQVEKIYERMANTAIDELAASSATEWILDNISVIRQAFRLIREDMPRGFYEKLPKLGEGPLEGYPRIYWLSSILVSIPDLQLESDNLQSFFTAYQEGTLLTIGELWAIPVMLRFAVLEGLTKTAGRVTGLDLPKILISNQKNLEPRSIDEEKGIANSILNLRSISTLDWKEIVERLSRVEKILRSDPVGVYPDMDFETRDRYRRVVEQISQAIGRTEEEVALEAIALAKMSQQAGMEEDEGLADVFSPKDRKSIYPGSPTSLSGPDFPEQARKAHVGFYLLERGRLLLEKRLGLRRTPWQRFTGWIESNPDVYYFGSIAALTAGLLAIVLFFLIPVEVHGALKWMTAFLTLIPGITVSVNLVNWFITLITPVQQLPKLDFSNGIPDSCRTMVVIPSMLSSPSDVDSLIQQMELHFLSNQDPNLYFALLTDFPDAHQMEMPNDKALIERAEVGIQTLTNRYPSWGKGRFSFFHRRRTWNPNENRWMGWERKRGKLTEFNRLIRGDRQTSYTVIYGAPENLAMFRYVITLDVDTLLPDGTARRLVGTIAHPLNQAGFDPKTRSVLFGYTILQPRVEIKPTSANQTTFSRIFSGDTGLDLYSRAVSDVYQDLFGEGSYVGKGIYDVDAFEYSLHNRVPENALLSHDLFEGIHGRAALVTDITLVEDFPPQYLVYIQRLHRWTRGDWQLLPWLLPYVPLADHTWAANRLSLLSRWKIFDNLRRSLFLPSLLLLLILGWTSFPNRFWIWSLLIPLVLAIPLLTSIGNNVNRFLWRKQHGLPGSFRFSTDFWRWCLALIFLPIEAFLSLHAIASTLFRLLVSRRGMLQWTTSAESVRRFGNLVRPGFPLRQMLVALVLTTSIGLFVGLVLPAALPSALPFLVLWFISPQISHWISQDTTRKTAPLSPEEHDRLRVIARRTWLFFEEFVGPEDHWLPPDHFQEEPLGIIAHRTSPTNIGLMLLSTLTAYDFGYMGVSSLAFRIRMTLDTLEQLERHRGHIFNWYDTRDLQPLAPRYVSTVDSGNLAASLLVLKQACSELHLDRIFRWERWRGLYDALLCLKEALESLKLEHNLSAKAPVLDSIAEVQQQILDVRNKPSHWAQVWGDLRSSAWNDLSQTLKSFIDAEGEGIDPSDLSNLRICSDLVHVHIFRVQREIDMFLPWLSALRKPPAYFEMEGVDLEVRDAWTAIQGILPTSPALVEIPSLCQVGKLRLEKLKSRLDQLDTQPEELGVAQEWCLWLSSALDDAQMEAEGLIQNLEELAGRMEQEFQRMDFSFLFSKQRQVFHIGYHVDTGRLDDNFYDLLASESRLASIVAMSKHEVPQSHWLHLSRPLTQVNGKRVMLSWSGTMFEYLMPSLMLKDYETTLIGQSDFSVIDRQIAYGLQEKVPWGISESGYYAFDSNRFYQYRAFGVPDLGYKRGLADDLVISPYASILALSFRPGEVLKNITRLIEIGMEGQYGFYEAVDFTPARLPLGHHHAIVRSYMAHHQGMILVSIANYLQNDRMVRRFHANTRIEGVELLLQERIPQDAPLEQTNQVAYGAIRPRKTKIAFHPWGVPDIDSMPRIHFLSNGTYGLLLTSSGSGYSQWEEIALTRWRADTTLENWGTWIYITDRATHDLWSVGYQPTAVQPQNQNVLFEVHKAEFWRQDHEISTRMEVTVAPDDDVEIRLISLANQSSKPRNLMLTSYAEVVLNAQAVDRDHPAFNKMFIESEYIPELNTLLFRRRTRSSEEDPIFMAHSLVLEPGRDLTGDYDADRSKFIGRRRTVKLPLALDPIGHGLSHSDGPTLDPIMALGQEIDLAPGASGQMAWITLATHSREDALTLIKRYRSWSTLIHTFDRARVDIEEDLGEEQYSSAEVENINRLMGALLFPQPTFRADSARLATNRKGQPDLWPFSISGDYPILLFKIGDQEESETLIELLRAHAYWRKRQVRVDLVILNEHGTGYSQDLNNYILRTINRMKGESWLNRRGGIFILNVDQMEAQDRVLLETVAKVILNGNAGSLSEQLTGRAFSQTRLPVLIPTLPIEREPGSTAPIARPENLLFDNGLGGFSQDGREYVIYLQPHQRTPAPWVNIIANEEFGFLVSESSLGYTWAENSGENRLTPWKNDPISDTPSEAIYLRDEETGAIWTPTPLPAGVEAPYLVRHGAGYSIFEHHSHDLHQQVKLYAVPEEPLKIVQLTLKNTTHRNRRITATYYSEWVLGTNRDQNQAFIIPEFDNQTEAMLARNPYNTEFAERVAFLAGSKSIHGLTSDRTEFLGRVQGYRRPAALGLVGLSGTMKAGLDPCAALMLHIDLPPGGSEQVYFLLGQGKDREATLDLIKRYQNPEEASRAWDLVNEKWDELLGAVQVKTPDPAMDLLLNRWLLYQTLTSRIWGRTGFYQSGGAYGFRDQLQDVMALVHSAPEIARQHLIEAAHHQFEEGDVLHWWHPPSGRGIRTRISDDLLWLPFVASHYVQTTGDLELLEEKIPFLKADPLKPDELERYALFPSTDQSFSLYEHCLRAIRRGLTAGSHGLPLIGTGDWNDGLSRVGVQGKGESVWLGWFLYAILHDFIPICEKLDDEESAQAFREQAKSLRNAIEEQTWDGAWYRRAYYDDGTPLGSSINSESQINSIAQSWAVLSGAADLERSNQAIDSLLQQLVMREEKIVLLLNPPFDKTSRDPGYIKSYPPGIRENGGQYTHGALWAAWALAKLGRTEEAEEMFRLLNPIYHGMNPERYLIEPYVIAADVYSNPLHMGRGGWTWYTGSAAWFYRLGLEAILGLLRQGTNLKLDPRIPPSWPNFQIQYRWGQSLYHIRVDNSEGVAQGVQLITLDGRVVSNNIIHLVDDGEEHVVSVELGS